MGIFASSSKENFYKKINYFLCNLKMIGTVDVNLPRRWAKRKDVWWG
jgi:hypothetical protein